ncbi:MAG: hypothetical protein VKK62_06645 [Synechococcaceae cyanobacterium]|nr:hypothetical protein [Synechococcaceae cyanobacterium]
MPGPDLGALLPADQRPLQLCRRHGLRWRREHSFRAEPGCGLLSNRYVLGIAQETISLDTWHALLTDLRLPLPERSAGGAASGSLRDELTARFQQASTVYLGFEQGVSGGNLRLYFEDWEAITRRLRQTPAPEIATWQTGEPPLWPMGVGYKWASAGGGRLRHTRYGVRPLLEGARIRTRAAGALQPPGWSQGGAAAGAVLRLLERILASDAAVAPVFLEVDEPGTPRRSFDLCVHRYGLRIEDLNAELQQLLDALLGPSACLRSALQGRSPQALVTHLSAGTSHHGMPYACLYYTLPDES